MSPQGEGATAERQPPSRARRVRSALWLAVRIAVAVGALWWTLSRVSMQEMLEAASRVTPLAAVIAVALTFSNLLVGSVRWRALLHAYGATRQPPITFLVRVYLVSIFYNTFLPGNVGGDVLRGHVTRRAFDGVASSYVVVLIERVFGLAGLLLLGASVLVFHPIGGVEGLSNLAVLGVVAALMAAASPVVGRRVAHWLPGRLRSVAGSLPAIERPSLLAVVLLLSMGTQTVVALTGWVLLDSIDPTVALVDALVLVPVALAAVYFPATVAGLGVREAAFVYLFTSVGVARADATAASLAFLAAQLVVAATGGILHAVAPLRMAED